jgi:GPH family glycoside/pentoside/hexuronide:cation symporter
MITVAFPFFLLYWVAQGDLTAKVRILGFDLAYESAFFGVLLSVAILSVRFWLWLAQKRNKREAYMIGMGFWVIVQLLIFTVPPQNVRYLLIIAALAGVGVSAAYTLPDSLFSDIIEWDELRTRRRQEGIYFGLRAFIRKVTGAFVVFVTLQALGWSGYQQPIDNVPQVQPASALMMIRLLVSLFGAVILSGVVVFTALFPLTRERYERVRKLLERRRGKSQSRLPGNRSAGESLNIDRM